MRRMMMCAAAIAIAVASIATVAIAPTPAEAQATCRNSCNDAEQACLKRTGNKGQCGNSAKTCLAKCK